MSESLRKRLKRSSRYYVSPVMPKCSSSGISESVSTSAETPELTKKHNVSCSSMDSSLNTSNVTDEIVEHDTDSLSLNLSTDTQDKFQNNRVLLQFHETVFGSNEELKKMKAQLLMSVAEKEHLIQKLDLVRIHKQKASNLFYLADCRLSKLLVLVLIDSFECIRRVDIIKCICFLMFSLYVQVD